MPLPLLQAEQVGDVTVVRVLSRSLVSEEVVDRLNDSVLQLAGTPGRRRVFLDLGRAELISGSLLSLLVRLFRRLHDGGGRLAIGPLLPVVEEVFTLVRLDYILDLRAGAWAGTTPPGGAVVQAFVQAVREEPDDTPCLVFADWLEDQGTPAARSRAEFIRLQCARARAGPDPLPPGPRERELLRAYEPEWLGPLPGLVRRWEWGRGFVEGLTVSGLALLDHGDDLFRLAPVRRLRLTTPPFGRWGPGLAEVLAAPALGLLHTLDLRALPLAATDVPALLAAPRLRDLGRLLLPGDRLDPAARGPLRGRWGGRVQF